MPITAPGSVEEPREPAPDRLAGGVLDGDVDLASRPRVAEASQRREHDVVHRGLEALGGEGLVEDPLHGRHIELMGRHEERIDRELSRSRRRAAIVRDRSCARRDVPPTHGSVRPHREYVLGGLARTPALVLHKTAHRHQPSN